MTILTAPARDSSAVRLALGGLLALAVAMGIGRFAYTPILPMMVEGLGLSQSQAGLIASANFAGYLAGALAAAFLPVPGSRRTWLMGALAASALTTLAMGAGGGMGAFLFWRTAGGIASAYVLVLASSLVLDRLAASGRSGVASLYFAGVGLGIVGSAALIVGVVQIKGDWRVAWLASGAAATLAWPIIAWLIPPDEPRPAAHVRHAHVSGRPIERRFAKLVAAYTFLGFGYVITATFIVAIVRAGPATRPLEPFIWVIVGCAAAPSVLLWNRVAAQIGTMRSYALASLVQAGGVAISVLAPNPVGIVLAAIMLGSTFMAMTALGFVAARKISNGDPRRAVALMTAAFGVGQIVGPVLAGFVHDRTGSFLWPSLLAAAGLVLSAAMTFRDPA